MGKQCNFFLLLFLVELPGFKKGNRSPQQNLQAQFWKVTIRSKV